MAMPITRARAADQSRFDQELKQNFAALGADGLANSDFAGALGYRDQHDVHDSDAADGQRQHGDQQQHDRQGHGDISSDLKNRGEVLHVVVGFGRGGGFSESAPTSWVTCGTSSGRCACA